MRVLAVVTVASLLMSPAASAATVTPQDAKGLTVASLEIVGLPGDLSGELRQGLRLIGRRKLIRVKKPEFFPQYLEEDVARARFFLARHGYPDAVVEPELALSEGSDPEVSITLRVTPGAPVRVHSLSTRDVPKEVDAFPEAPPLKPGAIFSDADLERTQAMLRTALREASYAKAEVRATVETVDTSRVAVELLAEPGPPYRLGSLQITGVSEDLTRVAAKVTPCPSGDPYRPQQEQDAKDATSRLGLFRQVQVEMVPAGGDTLDMHLSLGERDARLFEASAGYWTDEGPRVTARWLHRNLFRGGRSFETEATYSQFFQEAKVTTTWPGVFAPKNFLALTLKARYEDEDNYTQLAYGAEFGSTYWFSTKRRVRGGVQVFKNEVTNKTEEPVFAGDPGTNLVFFLEGFRDDTDDLFDPGHGSITQSTFQWGPGGFITENPFISGDIMRSWHWPAPRGVLAARAHFAAAAPLGDAVELLPDKRFFSGGAVSHRGFQRRRLGPKDATEEPVGGNSLVELSTEWRIQIVGRLRGAIFVDVGQVWAKVEETRFRDLEVGVGPALMVKTPIGPIRTDLGFRLTDIETDEPRTVFHFLIGHPY